MISASGSSDTVGAEKARSMSGALLSVLSVCTVARGVDCCSCLSHDVSSESVRGREFGLVLSKGCVCGSESGVSSDEDDVLLIGTSSGETFVIREATVSVPVSWSIS